MIHDVILFRNLIKVNLCNFHSVVRAFGEHNRSSLCAFIRSYSAGTASSSTMSRKKEKNMAQPQAAVDKNSQPKTQKRKEKVGPGKAPSTINIVVIGTGGPGSSHSVLVTTEVSRYMFNCGEGTQRLAAMSKGLRILAFAKLARLENIFITHKSWGNTGGLLAMALSLEGHLNPESKAYLNRPAAGNSGASITIYGPQGVEKIVLMAKRFAQSANLNIVKGSDTFNDKALTIRHVPFYRSAPQAAEERSQSENGEPAAKKLKQDSPLVSETDEAYAYICHPNPSPPKINLEKCLDAGITVGPMVGQLQRGETVTLPDGRVVLPEQVTDNLDQEKRPFLILECPSIDFLLSLSTNEEINQRMAGTGEDSFVLVVHMTPSEVYDTEQYQAWMRKFSASTNHLVLNRSAGEVDLMRVRTHQTMLNVVSNDVFPMLPAAVEGTGADVGATESGTGRLVFATSGTRYAYRGKEEGFQCTPDELNVEETQQECLASIKDEDKLKALRDSQLSAMSGTNDDIKACISDASVPDEASSDKGKSLEGSCLRYPQVTFLGTGSSEPNKIRSQSCILVQLSQDSVIILDCGEDSYGQLYRFFGAQKAAELLKKIKAIFVSHLHADHHLGLFTLLKEREKALATAGEEFSRVFLMAPVQVVRWLDFYQKEVEAVLHLFRFVKHQHWLKIFAKGIALTTATYEDLKADLQLAEYNPVQVEHCSNAFGLAIRQASGYKLVYSGDTRPCDNLVQAGLDCNLLIHEATHEDRLTAHAKASKHSTFSEAMEVGSKMRAKHIILTHFSPRYAHMVPFYDMELPHNVGIAFDNMQVNPQTISQLPPMIPLLTSIFAEKLKPMETQRIKQLREEAEMREYLDEEKGVEGEEEKESRTVNTAKEGVYQ